MTVEEAELVIERAKLFALPAHVGDLERLAEALGMARPHEQSGAEGGCGGWEVDEERPLASATAIAPASGLDGYQPVTEWP